MDLFCAVLVSVIDLALPNAARVKICYYYSMRTVLDSLLMHLLLIEKI